jgi:hypothetical protein
MKYTDQELIESLQKFFKEFGYRPVQRDCVSIEYLKGKNTYCTRFGSWSNAIKASGLDKEKVRERTSPSNKVSTEDLIQYIKELHKKLGKSPTALDARKYSVRTYCNRFGTWNEALEAASIKPNTPQKWVIRNEGFPKLQSKDWLLQQNKTKTLREIAKSLGYKSVRSIGKAFEELSIKPRRHKESLKEKEWLDSLGITERQYPIVNYRVDGFDPETNTVYEFLGDYWHGNPEVYDPDDYNKSCSKTFGQLFDETNKRLEHIKSLGYNIITKWENDYENTV